MRFVVFGSGGLAKEILGYLPSVLYLVSDKPGSLLGHEVRDRVGPITQDVGFILAVADPEIKKKIVSENDDHWTTYIHPTCTVSPYARIGKGCVLAPQSIVTGDAVLGDFVFMNTNATVGHDTTIGRYTTLFPNSEVCGDCEIGESCLFGIGSYVLPKVKLPEGTKVSAGAIVRKSPIDNRTLYGDPAKPKDH